MKKLLTLSSIILAITASSALAKTQGNYIGLSLVDSKTTDKYLLDGDSKKDKDRATSGVGVDYKYAFNFDNFFVAPGVFFDKLGTRADSETVNYNYGVKADIGYDVLDQVAVYFTNGLANTNYAYSNGGGARKNSTSYMNYFYGVGLAYSPVKNISFKFEYTMQDGNDLRASTSTNRIKNDLRAMRFGVAYNF